MSLEYGENKYIANCVSLLYRVSFHSHDHYSPKYSKTTTGSWFNIKMSSLQYRESHSGDGNPIVEIRRSIGRLISSKGFPITGKMSSFYWIGPWLPVMVRVIWYSLRIDNILMFGVHAISSFCNFAYDWHALKKTRLIQQDERGQKCYYYLPKRSD